MEILEKFIIPIIVALGSSGAVIAWIKYKETKPENIAKARNLNVTADVTLSETAVKYAGRMEKRVEDLEKRVDDLITKYNDLSVRHHFLEEENKLLRAENEIFRTGRKEREEQIKHLEREIENLKRKLTKYQFEKDKRVDIAKEEIKETVEETLEDIKDGNNQ